MKKSESGFTLVELLASISVVVIVGILIVAIISSTFRGANKTNVITNVRQNGYAAITIVAKMLQDAKKLEAIDGSTDLSSCIVSAVVSPTPEPMLTPHQSITISSFDGQETTFSCETSPEAMIASNGASLIDTQTVSVSDCYFTCRQTAKSEGASIGINFFLNSAAPAGSLTDLNASGSAIPFQTTVTVRNFTR